MLLIGWYWKQPCCCWNLSCWKQNSSSLSIINLIESHKIAWKTVKVTLIHVSFADSSNLLPLKSSQKMKSSRKLLYISPFSQFERKKVLSTEFSFFISKPVKAAWKPSLQLLKIQRMHFIFSILWIHIWINLVLSRTLLEIGNTFRFIGFSFKMFHIG